MEESRKQYERSKAKGDEEWANAILFQMPPRFRHVPSLEEAVLSDRELGALLKDMNSHIKTHRSYQRSHWEPRLFSFIHVCRFSIVLDSNTPNKLLSRLLGVKCRAFKRFRVRMLFSRRLSIVDVQTWFNHDLDSSDMKSISCSMQAAKRSI